MLGKMTPLRHYWSRNILYGVVGLLIFAPFFIRYGIYDAPWDYGGLYFLLGTFLFSVLGIYTVYYVFTYLIIPACPKCYKGMVLELIDRKDYYTCGACGHKIWTGSSLDES